MTLAQPLTGAECREGRALLGWTIGDLAARALCCGLTVRNIERGRGKPQVTITTALRAAFARGGVEFAAGRARWRTGPDLNPHLGPSFSPGFNPASAR